MKYTNLDQSVAYWTNSDRFVQVLIFVDGKWNAAHDNWQLMSESDVLHELNDAHEVIERSDLNGCDDLLDRLDGGDLDYHAFSKYSHEQYLKSLIEATPDTVFDQASASQMRIEEIAHQEYLTKYYEDRRTRLTELGYVQLSKGSYEDERRYWVHRSVAIEFDSMWDDGSRFDELRESGMVI